MMNPLQSLKKAHKKALAGMAGYTDLHYLDPESIALPAPAKETVTAAYITDNNGWSKNVSFFRTDNPDPRIMQLLSWVPGPAGRIGTGYPEFKELMNYFGYRCEDLPPQTEVRFTITGATGNY